METLYFVRENFVVRPECSFVAKLLNAGAEYSNTDWLFYLRPLTN